MSGATVVGQSTPAQGGDVKGFVLPAASEAVEEVLGESATSTVSTSAAPPSLAVGAGSTAAGAPKSSFLQPAAHVDEAAPATNPQPTVWQEHIALGSAARATSPEIQETGEVSSVARPWKPEEGDALILDLAYTSCAATFEAGIDADEDEESALCHSLESGLTWAHRAFDELILPATTVCSLDAAACSGFLLFFQLFVVDALFAWSRHLRCPVREGCAWLASSTQRGPS